MQQESALFGPEEKIQGPEKIFVCTISQSHHILWDTDKYLHILKDARRMGALVA